MGWQAHTTDGRHQSQDQQKPRTPPFLNGVFEVPSGCDALVSHPLPASHCRQWPCNRGDEWDVMSIIMLTNQLCTLVWWVTRRNKLLQVVERGLAACSVAAELSSSCRAARSAVNSSSEYRRAASASSTVMEGRVRPDLEPDLVTPNNCQCHLSIFNQHPSKKSMWKAHSPR
jgi:hypothetical protein